MRPDPAPLIALALSLGAAFLVFTLILGATGYSVSAFYSIMVRDLASPYRVESTLLYALPIALIALGLGVVFRMGYWNIGGEGQAALGMAAALWIGVFVSHALPGPLVKPVMLLAAMAAGALWALPPALLRAYAGVNEVLSTLMLNYVAAYLLGYLVEYPWRDPEAFGFIRTPSLPGSASLGAAGGLLILLGATALVKMLSERTVFGFQARIMGSGSRVSRYAGVNYPLILCLAAALSGALAGAGGMAVVSGLLHFLGEVRDPSSPASGYGYSAIIAAWLGRLDPVGIVLASLLLGVLFERKAALQYELGIGVGYTMLLNGLILLAVIASRYLEDRVRGVMKR